MKRLIFATGNENKMKEIREIMEGLPVEILSMISRSYFILFSLDRKSTRLNSSHW